MRTMQRNKVKFLYSNYNESETIYELDTDGNVIYDSYTDTDGTVYNYPKEIGSTSPGYTSPKKMYANISMSGGEAEAREFGLDVSQYSAILICEKNKYNIDETSIIWYKNSVEYKDAEETEIEPNSADYRVVKVSESINYVRYVLQKVINNVKSNTNALVQ